MNKYAVAILNFFDNVNEIFIVHALTELDAIKQAMIATCKSDAAKTSQAEWQEQWRTVPQALEECINSDIAISNPVLISEYTDN
jgi:hypothetical protein